MRCNISSTNPEGDTFDIIVLSCKAYDLDAALDSISPAIGADSFVLPLLNGVSHLDMLDAKFGRECVLGGVAHLSVTQTPSGEIMHLNKAQAYELARQRQCKTV